LCQVCEKNNATIHFTKIINGNVEERHLCDLCAKNNNDLDFDLPFSFQKIFTGLIDSIQEGQAKVKNISCPKCGLTYERFMKNGKFGCSNCYEVFKEDVESLLKGIHGHNEHNGKIPKRANKSILQKREIETLRIDLQNAIEDEDFEKAALLRDEIKIIKDNLDNSKR